MKTKKLFLTVLAVSAFIVMFAVLNVSADQPIREKVTVASSSGSQSWGGSCPVSQAFDNKTETYYASKDSAEAKYIEADLGESLAISEIGVVGRNDNTTFASRVNEARVYASNEPMNGDPSKGELIGYITGISDGSEKFFKLLTDGKAYRYYMLYLPIKNNGNNISLNVAEIFFYTSNCLQAEVSPISVTDGGGTPVTECTDGETDTSYSVTGQTAETIANQYVIFDLGENNNASAVYIQKQVLGAHNFWDDWVNGVGCVLQGSNDKENWEIISKMNSKPDGCDNLSADIHYIDGSYRYIRYIRTSLQNYAIWLIEDSRLNIAEVKFYKEISLPEITQELGWNQGKFTINYIFGNSFTYDIKSNYTTGIDVAFQGGGEAHADYDKNYQGVAFATENTNRIYTASPFLEINQSKLKGKALTTSIYKLVTDAVASGKYNSKNPIIPERLNALNEVIKNGGIYLVKSGNEYKLTEETSNILILESFENDTAVLKLTENAKNAGLSFIVNKGETSDNVSITVNIGTAQTQEAEVILLDAVQLEFVPEEMRDEAVDEIEIVFDFTEGIM